MQTWSSCLHDQLCRQTQLIPSGFLSTVHKSSQFVEGRGDSVPGKLGKEESKEVFEFFSKLSV